MPFITSAMVIMLTAQSPRLRRKFEKFFRAESPTQDTPFELATGLRLVEDGLASKLWKLLQTKMPIAAFRGSLASRNLSIRSALESQEEGMEEPTQGVPERIEDPCLDDSFAGGYQEFSSHEIQAYWHPDCDYGALCEHTSPYYSGLKIDENYNPHYDHYDPETYNQHIDPRDLSRNALRDMSDRRDYSEWGEQEASHQVSILVGNSTSGGSSPSTLRGQTGVIVDDICISKTLDT